MVKLGEGGSDSGGGSLRTNMAEGRWAAESSPDGGGVIPSLRLFVQGPMMLEMCYLANHLLQQENGATRLAPIKKITYAQIARCPC